MKSCVVIYNPNSGRILRKKKLNHFRKLFEKHGYSVKFIGTRYHGHAKELVYHMKTVDLVMSMGGDGTFNECVFGNFQRKNKLVLAHIPVGTTNDVGVMFGYGKNLEKNIELCLTGKIKTIDIPTVNKRPFVYVAGFGKFLNIPYDTPRIEKQKMGYLAYIWNGIKDFFRITKNYHVTYEIDGKEYSGLYSFMIVMNATRIAGMDSFLTDVKLNDDTFEVLFCTYTRMQDIIKVAKLLLTKDVTSVDGIEFYKTNNIKIKFEKHPSKAWCVDGEKLEIRTKTYEIKNTHELELLIPTKNIDKLFVRKKKDK